jgi:hypothetical protein
MAGAAEKRVEKLLCSSWYARKRTLHNGLWFRMEGRVQILTAKRNDFGQIRSCDDGTLSGRGGCRFRVIPVSKSVRVTWGRLFEFHRLSLQFLVS